MGPAPSRLRPGQPQGPHKGPHKGPLPWPLRAGAARALGAHMAELLHVEGLKAGYGEAVVLNGITLSLAAGESLALLGRNGTGKTTFINTLVGVTRRHAGRIVLGGRDVTALPPFER